MQELILVPLKIKNIPLIEKEVNCFTQMYLTIKQRIQKGDIDAVQDLSEIKQKINRRLQQFDVFYRMNQNDIQIQFLYSSRTILKKMANNFGEELPQIQEYSYQTVWKKQASKSKGKTDINSKTISIKSVSPIKISKNSSFSKQRLSNKQNSISSSNCSYNKQVTTLNEHNQCKNERHPKQHSEQKRYIDHSKSNPREILQKQNNYKKSNQKNNFAKGSFNNSKPKRSQCNSSQIQPVKSTQDNPKQSSNLIFNIKFTKQLFAEIMKEKHRVKTQS